MTDARPASRRQTFYMLAIIVLIPLAGLPVRTATMGWNAFWATVTDPRVVASYQLTLTTAFFPIMRSFSRTRCSFWRS